MVVAAGRRESSQQPSPACPIPSLPLPRTLRAVPDDLDVWMTEARDRVDRESFTRVVEGCHHVVRSSLLRDTADPELADEMAQESFVRAWERRAQYRTGTSPRAWILAIARSLVLEHARRQDRDRRHLDALVRQELVRHRGPDDGGDGERLVALRSCLETLDQEARHLLDLVFGRGLTSEAAAEELGISPEACRQRLSRLQRRLREATTARLEPDHG